MTNDREDALSARISALEGMVDYLYRREVERHTDEKTSEANRRYERRLREGENAAEVIADYNADLVNIARMRTNG